MSEKFKDRSLGILAAGIDDTATELTLLTGNGNKFIDPSIDGAFYAQIFRGDKGTPALDGNAEWILVTATNGDIFTITRAQRGDTAKTHNDLSYTYYLMAGPGADYLNNLISSINGKSGDITLTKDDVGLNNVDNTSDLDKPISTTIQTALDGKVDKITGKGLSTNDYIDTDKTKLDGIETGAQVNTITSVSSRTGDIILTKTDVGLNNVDNTSDVDKPISTATQTALDAKADLVDGLIPSTQLPLYIDNVIEVDTFSSLPANGESAKIYVTKDTNLTYRWAGSDYVEISKSLALGETSSTAYRGDRGKTAYNHSQQTSGNPHNVNQSDIGLSNVDNTSDANKPISTATQTALDAKADLMNGTIPLNQLPTGIGGDTPDYIRQIEMDNVLNILSLQAANSISGSQNANMIYDIFSIASGYKNTIDTNNSTALFTSDSYKNINNYLKSLLHFNGANGSTTFVDDLNKIWTIYGGAQISTAQSKFGGASGYFNGSDAYIATPLGPDFNFGSLDFTIDFWYYPNDVSSTQCLINFYQDVNNYYAIYLSGGKLSFVCIQGGTTIVNYLQITASLSTAQWYHIAWERHGDNMYLYIDGIGVTLTENITISGVVLPNFTGTLQIGRDGRNQYYTNAYIDELIIYNGIARWSADFTPLTTEYIIGSNIVQTITESLSFAPSNFQVYVWRSTITGTGGISADISFNGGINWQTGVDLNTATAIANAGTSLILKLNINANLNPELLINNSFENGLTNWTGYKYGGSGDPLTLETGIIRNGSNAARLTDIDTWGGLAYQEVILVADTTYKVGAWFYFPSTNTPTAVYISIGTTVSNILDRYKYLRETIDQSVKDQWIYREFTFTPDQTDVVFVQFEISGNNQNCYIVVDVVDLMANNVNTAECQGYGIMFW